MTSHSAIPTSWSPEQALAMLQFLQQLSELIWAHYELVIVDLVGDQEAQSLRPQLPLPTPSTIDLFDTDPYDNDDFDWPF